MKKQTQRTTSPVCETRVQQSSFSFPVQAYSPFQRQPPTPLAAPAPPQRVRRGVSASLQACAVGRGSAATPQRKSFNEGGGRDTSSNSSSSSASQALISREIPSAERNERGRIDAKMSVHHRVAVAESQGFLRAKVAAKEQLCSQVIGENQTLIRQLEEIKAQHRQTVERLKA